MIKLRRHRNNPDFKQFCLSHDIVCLIERWAKEKDDYSTLLETHHPFSFVRSAENHFSGGIIAYVRNELLPGCVRTYENFNDLVGHTIKTGPLDPKTSGPLGPLTPSCYPFINSYD